VYLGFRSDQSVPSWLAADFELTSHVVMVRADVFHHAFKIYESKALYIPGADSLPLAMLAVPCKIRMCCTFFWTVLCLGLHRVRCILSNASRW
jgi:hypothetical protein